MANMSKQDYINLQKETVAKSRSIYKKALEYCPELFTPETYPEFLSFLARWNHFSAINSVLLFMQYPKATYISGFQRWQKLALEQGHDNNYMIVKPEQRKKGITLLIPFSFTNVQNSSGQQEEQRFLTYKSILVFDVSQVNGLQTPPCFKPYVPIHNLNFKVFLSICRNQFQKDIRFSPGTPEEPNFKFSRAYLKGNTIYYHDAAPDEEKTMAIIKEIVRYYVYQTCKDEKEKDLVLLSTVYALYSYYKYPTDSTLFTSISYYESLGSERLLYLLHYISSLMQFLIYQFYRAYSFFLSNYSDNESNRILEQYKEM